MFFFIFLITVSSRPASRTRISGEIMPRSPSLMPWKEGNPDGHGRLSLKGNEDGHMGSVVNGSISYKETFGCLSSAVDSS